MRSRPLPSAPPHDKAERHSRQLLMTFPDPDGQTDSRNGSQPDQGVTPPVVMLLEQPIGDTAIPYQNQVEEWRQSDRSFKPHHGVDLIAKQHPELERLINQKANYRDEIS